MYGSCTGARKKFSLISGKEITFGLQSRVLLPVVGRQLFPVAAVLHGLEQMPADFTDSRVFFGDETSSGHRLARKIPEAVSPDSVHQLPARS